MDIDIEKIVSVLIKLLEDQENAKITYQIIPGKENKPREDTA